MRWSCALLLGVVLLPGVAVAQPQFEVIGPGYHPRLLADETGRLHLLLHDGDRLFYRAWVGGSWTAAGEVPGSQGVPGHKFTRGRMSATPDGERIHVSWGTGYGTDIQLAARDAGVWSGPETACSAGIRLWEYAAVTATSPGDVYVLCMVDDLWVAHRDPAGAWEEPQQVVVEAAKHVAAVTGADDEIHLVWRFDRVRTMRGDGGDWTGPHDVSAAAGSAELPAQVLGTGGLVHVAWQQWIEVGGWTPDTVRYSAGLDDQWTNGGEGVVVAQPAAVFNPPELAVDGFDNVLVTWVEDHSLMLSWSTHSGQTFGSPELLAADAQPVQDGNLEHDLATAPVVIVGEDIHIVYEDDQRRLVHVTGLTTESGGDDDSGDDDAGDDDVGDDDAGGDDDTGGGGGCSCGVGEIPATIGTTMLLLLWLVWRR